MFVVPMTSILPRLLDKLSLESENRELFDAVEKLTELKKIFAISGFSDIDLCEAIRICQRRIRENLDILFTLHYPDNSAKYNLPAQEAITEELTPENFVTMRFIQLRRARRIKKRVTV